MCNLDQLSEGSAMDSYAVNAVLVCIGMALLTNCAAGELNVTSDKKQ